MKLFSANDFQTLIKPQGYPSISVYLNLPSYSDKDKCLYSKLRSQFNVIDECLSEACSREETQVLMTPLWQTLQCLHEVPHDTEGLAIFRSSKTTGIFPSSTSFDEHLAISDSFHLKPILPMIQRQNAFHVVALTQYAVHLMSGDRNSLKATKSYQFDARDSARSTTEPKQNAVVEFQPRSSIHKYWSKCSTDIAGIVEKNPGPVIAVGSNYLRRTFVATARIPNLLNEGINFRYSPGHSFALHKKAWGIAENFFHSRALVLANQYLALLARDRASDKIADIAEAIFHGRVAHIVIAKDRSIFGRLDRGTGRVVTLRKNVDPIGDDILCDLAQEVILRGGIAHVLPQEKMPTRSPVAALYRW